MYGGASDRSAQLLIDKIEPAWLMIGWISFKGLFCCCMYILRYHMDKFKTLCQGFGKTFNRLLINVA